MAAEMARAAAVMAAVAAVAAARQDSRTPESRWRPRFRLYTR